MKYKEVFTYKNLFKSFKKCLKGVKWKGTAQFYNQHALSQLYITYKQLENRKVNSGHFFCFPRMERGKVRHIKSVRINERVVQRCLCDYCLVPSLTKHFIYDNSACIKDKGIHFALRRFRHNLHNYYLKYGNNEGYIVQFDFHHYFDTINHKYMTDMVRPLIKDNDLFNLYSQLVNDFPEDKGLGLGSQISQISALYFSHDIDNYFYNDPKVFAYARYMDDGYIICDSKDKASECLAVLYLISNKLGLEMNEKKTQIYKMTSMVEFLKARVRMKSDGTIIMKPNRKNITRNRQKLKKLFALKINFIQINNFVRMVIGNLRHYNSYHTRLNFILDYQITRKVYIL